jgi:hypothetical protein
MREEDPWVVFDRKRCEGVNMIFDNPQLKVALSASALPFPHAHVSLYLITDSSL